MSIVNFGFGPKKDAGKPLPPGQSVVSDWPVLTYGPTPHIDTKDWTITIDGEVNKPITLTWDEFMQLPKTKLKTDIHCVTRWSRLDMPWEGVTFDELLKKAGGPTTKAKFVIAASIDSGYENYTSNIPLAETINGQAMVAFAADDKPLSPEHGGPARFFVPHLYFWKSAKWVHKITLTTEDQPGFWERYGYNNHGDPWREERYDTDG